MSMILAMRSDWLEPHIKDGVTPANVGQVAAWMPPGALFFGPRAVLEEDEGFRQIIPYVVVYQRRQVLIYRRTPKGGEQRLAGKWSAGWGGHVELGDAQIGAGGELHLTRTLNMCVTRELDEELALTTDSRANLSWLGVVRADDTPVARVHVGVVMLWELDAEFELEHDLQPTDPAIGEIRMGRPSELLLKADEDRFEGWTRSVLEHLSAKGW